MVIQVLISGILIGGIYALLASGLSLTLGVMRVINLSHGVFYTLGSFILYSFFMQGRLNIFLSFLITALIVFIVGFIIEKTLLERVRELEMNVMILTFALAIFGEELIRLGWGVMYRSSHPFIKGSLQIGDLFFDYQRVLSFVVGMGMLSTLIVVIKKTKLGKAARMVQQDHDMAMLLGINVKFISAFVFGLGAMLSAAAACLLAPLYLIFPAMGWTPLLISFAIVILGGMGSITGTVIAGLLFGVVTLLTSYYISSGMVNVVPFLVIIIVLVFRPSGIMGKDIF